MHKTGWNDVELHNQMETTGAASRAEQIPLLIHTNIVDDRRENHLFLAHLLNFMTTSHIVYHLAVLSIYQLYLFFSHLIR